MQQQNVQVIAEIGTSHGGSLEKAYRLIDAAVSSGADVIKFQWVYADEILHPQTGLVALPGGAVRLYDRFKALEVSPQFFESCLSYTHKAGAQFMCSPFGLRSLTELLSIHPDAVKIASPEVNHIPLLTACEASCTVPVVLSSGVSKLCDIERALDILEGGLGKNQPVTLLHCITNYPAPESEYNVRAVDSLRRIFGVPTGISDHSLDPVLVPTLAVAMGATMIEKHITLSRETDGLDDPVALEPEQFAQMVYAVRQACAVLERFGKDEEAGGVRGVYGEPCGSAKEVQNALYNRRFLLNAGQAEIVRQLSDQYGSETVSCVLGTGVKRLAPSERAHYGRTNRSLHYMRDIKKGARLATNDIAVLRTEKVLSVGLHPDFLPTIMGATLQRDVSAGEGVSWDDVLQKTAGESAHA